MLRGAIIPPLQSLFGVIRNVSLTFSHSRAERAACCRKFGCRPLAAAAAAGTPIQKPTFDRRDPRNLRAYQTRESQRERHRKGKFLAERAGTVKNATRTQMNNGEKA
jgi:hypothetical protein